MADSHVGADEIIEEIDEATGEERGGRSMLQAFLDRVQSAAGMSVEELKQRSAELGEQTAVKTHSALFQCVLRLEGHRALLDFPIEVPSGADAESWRAAKRALVETVEDATELASATVPDLRMQLSELCDQCEQVPPPGPHSKAALVGLCLFYKHFALIYARTYTSNADDTSSADTDTTGASSTSTSTNTSTSSSSSSSLVPHRRPPGTSTSTALAMARPVSYDADGLTNARPNVSRPSPFARAGATRAPG